MVILLFFTVTHTKKLSEVWPWKWTVRMSTSLPISSRYQSTFSFWYILTSSALANTIPFTSYILVLAWKFFSYLSRTLFLGFVQCVSMFSFKCQLSFSSRKVNNSTNSFYTSSLKFVAVTCSGKFFSNNSRLIKVKSKRSFPPVLLEHSQINDQKKWMICPYLGKKTWSTKRGLRSLNDPTVW